MVDLAARTEPQPGSAALRRLVHDRMGAEDLSSDLADVVPADRTALLVGGEGHGLSARWMAEADRRVRNYSLGMRQRLGIACALIGEPAALILDEPANGLDPAGIRWMRDLLRDYADRGGTVLLSSHLLNEIEAIADDLVVIGQGRIVAQGAKSELLQASGTVARTPRIEDLARALGTSGLAARPTADGALHIDADPELVGQVALHAGLVLTELRSAESNGLEEIFLELTADSQREGAAA